MLRDEIKFEPGIWGCHVGENALQMGPHYKIDGLIETHWVVNSDHPLNYAGCDTLTDHLGSDVFNKFLAVFY